jgi:hypothetical protein
MKTFVNYLEEHKEFEMYISQWRNGMVVGYTLEAKLQDDIIWIKCADRNVSIEKRTYVSDSDYLHEEIIEILNFFKLEIRFCEECGKPYDAGIIMCDGDWYCCEECFEGSMDESYGKGNWRGTDEEGVCGGFYEHLNGDEWLDTGVFYTEWY